MTTTTEPAAVRAAVPLQRAPAIDVVVPVYNEEADLAPSVRRLHAYLDDEFPFSFRITIADNASTVASTCPPTWPPCCRWWHRC